MPVRAVFPTSLISNAATAGLLVTYCLVALWGMPVLGPSLAPTTLTWPAAGIGLALVLLRGMGVWPLIFAAAAVLSAMTIEEGTWITVVGTALGNGAVAALEPMLAAWLIWRVAGEDYLERAGRFVLAMLVAAPVAALVATFPLVIGAISTDLVTIHSPDLGWLRTWHTTTASEALSLLMLTPVACIWARNPEWRLTPRQVFELLGLGSVAALVLTLPDPGQPHYLLFGAHLAIAFRLPLPWSAAAVALTSCVYLAQSALDLAAPTPPALYDSFLTEITFLLILNATTYVAALLKSEALAQAERRESMLREREAWLREREGLLRALGSAEQRERRRIAEILHDNLQQLLIAAKMAVASEPARAESILDEAISAARTLTVEMHPPVLDERGLAAAFHWLGDRFHELHGLAVHVEADEAADPTTPETAYYLFQAVRGLLMNVIKHAETDTAWLRLRETQGWLIVEVEDHGKGCDPSQLGHAEGEGHRYGHFAMRQRVELLGGEIHISGEHGCRVTLTVPLSTGAKVGTGRE
ncbi:MAG: ATP-binding protein [Halofilum sp. (in: g-proteobacteria)]